MKPPPMASNSRRCRGSIRRSATASKSASGTEAAEVLPSSWTVTTTWPARSELLRRTVDDPSIGLMRDEPSRSSASAGRLEGVLDHAGDLPDGEAEDLLALHAQMADRLGRGGPPSTKSWRVPAVRAICVVSTPRSSLSPRPGTARARSRRRHRRTGRGEAIGPVEDAGEGLRADHQRAAMRAESRNVGRRTAKTKPRKPPEDRRPRPAYAERRLKLRRGRRKSVVRRRSRQKNRSMTAAAHPACANAACAALAPASRSSRHRRNVPPLDAGALDDPVVARIDDAREIVIGDRLLRQGAADASHDRAETRP